VLNFNFGHFARNLVIIITTVIGILIDVVACSNHCVLYLMNGVFSGIILEYEQRGLQKTKIIDLLDLRSEYVLLKFRLNCFIIPIALLLL
jgi:hypothetical protein